MADLVHVKGLAELNKLLQELPVRLERNVLRGSLRAGANAIKPAAFANINHISGELGKSLKVRSNARGGQVTASVYTRMWYAKFVEFGTRPHTITAKGGGALAFGGALRWSVEHPGIAPYGNKQVVGPHSFLRPAMDAQAGAAVVAAAEYMKGRLSSKHGIDTADIVIEEVEA